MITNERIARIHQKYPPPSFDALFLLAIRITFFAVFSFSLSKKTADVIVQPMKYERLAKSNRSQYFGVPKY